MKCLYVGAIFDRKIKTGGDVINKRNYSFLSQYYDCVDTFFTGNPSKKNSKFFVLKNIILNGTFSSLTQKDINKLIKLIEEKKYDVCYFADSTFGFLEKIIKNKFPNIYIYTFFHNVEYNFYKQIASGKNIYKFPLPLCAKNNEELVMKYSDKIISINQRDANEIERIYGRTVDFVLPTSFEDQFTDMDHNEQIKKLPVSLLFVGSDFYANEHGIRWFVSNVLPKINAKVFIVGRGTERWKDFFLDNNNVNVLGAVDDLAACYRKADAVIIPIFEGSGMKTKTAEALMYGKNVYGTTEAFEGYDLDYDKIGGKCDTPEEFIQALNHDLMHRTKYNRYSRDIFKKSYSNDVWYEKFSEFLSISIA